MKLFTVVLKWILNVLTPIYGVELKGEAFKFTKLKGGFVIFY